MSFKQSIIRFATLALSCLMVMSVPLTALADNDVNQNANSGGSIPSGEDAAYAHKFYAYPCNQGWRFTIVDQKGNPVSNSVDAVVYFPTDIEDIALANSTPTVSGATGSTSELLEGYQKYKNWIGWTDNTKTGGLNQTKDKTLVMSNGIKTREFTDISWNHFGVPNTVVNGRSIQNKVYPICDLNDYLRRSITYLIQDEGGTPDANLIKQLEIPVPSILKGNQFSAGGTLLKEMAIKNLSDLDVNKRDISSNVIKAVLNAKVPVYNNKCKYTGIEDYLFRYIDPSDDNRIGTTGQDGEKIFVSNIFTERNYRLAVEPIYFGIPEIVAYDTGVVQKVGSWHVAWANGVWYGTVSYVNKQIYKLASESQSLKNLGLTESDLDKCTVFPDWGFGNMGPTTAMLSHNEESMGIYEPSQEGHSLHRLTNGFSLYSMASGDRYRTVGYALHLYTPDMLEESSGTPTWDSEKYPSDNYKPEKAPDTSDTKKYPKETEYNTNNNKANIVKFYVRKQGDKEIPVSNFTRENTLHTININDEPGYKVVDYFSSNTYKKPDSQSTTYESVKSLVPNGSLKGTSSGQVTLTPASNENTLYIKLISNVKVVKIYETNGNVDKIETDTNPNITDNTLHITTPDNGYEYTENVQSPTDKTPTSWDDIPSGTPSSDVDVPLNDDTTTIYIHYNKENNNTGLVLHENEISHQFTLSNVNGTLLDGIQKWSGTSSPGSCDYWYDGDDDDDGYYCGSSYDYQYSENWSYSIENRPNYNKQFVWKWLQTDQKSYSGGGLTESGGSGNSTPNMDMVLQRSVSDKATLYPNKNSDEATLKEMGLQGAAYQPVHQRKDGSADQDRRKEWRETFTTAWTFFDVARPGAYYEADHGSSYGEGWDYHENNGDNSSSLNSNYSQSGNTIVYGLWGKANTGDTAPSNEAQQFKLDGVNESQQKMKSTFESHDKFIQYYPYYKMKYVLDLGSGEKDAILTSENLSKTLRVNRVDVSVSQTSSGIPIDLTSTQWSIHSGAQRLIHDKGNGDKDSLLPSGAIYNLQMKGGDNNGVWVKFRTYQTVVDDADKVKLADGSDNKTLSEAKVKSNTFMEQAKKSLDNYEIVMLGSKGFANENTVKGEWNQITGAAKKNKPLGSELASDDKYKLEANTGKANASDLDVLNTVNYNITWKLTSDADGNVKVYKNNSEVAGINKAQSISQLISGNTELTTLDDRTKIVTNFVNSLDRNKGKDRNVKSWYNEGFESIVVYEHDFAFLMGFGNNNPIRSAALNIKLNGYLNSRQEMFTEDDLENTARTFQFRTSKKSVISEASGKPDGWVGDFEGLVVTIPQIDSLLTTKLFYTSNTTVMDLN